MAEHSVVWWVVTTAASTAASTAALSADRKVVMKAVDWAAMTVAA